MAIGEKFKAIGEKVTEFGGKVKEKSKKTKLSKKQLIILGCCAVAVIGTGIFVGIQMFSKNSEGYEYEIVKVEKRTITRTIDSSSVVAANDTYDVTALVTGEILEDYFSEGDVVTKDQVLYQIDSSDAKDKLDQAENALTEALQKFEDAVKKKADTIKTNDMSYQSAQNSLTKAKSTLESAQRSYNTAVDNYNDLNVKSEYTGKVSELLVKTGDSVSNGTKIASFYNDEWFEMQVPFIETSVSGISVGDTAEITIASSGDKLSGEVTAIASATTATEAHAIVRYITIVAANPGGLNGGESASAMVNGIACSDLGVLEYYEEGYLTAKVSGTIEALYINANDHVTVGQTIGIIKSDSAYDSLKNAETTLNNAKMSLDEAYDSLEKVVINNDTYSLDSSIQSAEISLDNAKLSLETAKENMEDYQIKAPIDGTIITKNKKAGDKLEQNNSSSSEPMAVIYDMSALKVELTIDESEIHNVSVGQKVMITSDAVKGMFEGEVTKVGVNGTSSNGVTTYPVEVTITEYGDLLPSMNVDCVIEIESAEDVLAVPVSAIQRGNMVYVKGDKTEESDNAPEGFYSVKVETGATDSMYIEVKEGLQEGQEICGAVKATGVEAEGQGQQGAQQAMPGMGGMPGGMGGGMPGGMGGGMPGGGGNRGGMGGGMR